MITNLLEISTMFFDNMFWTSREQRGTYFFQVELTNIFKGEIKVSDLLKEISRVEFWNQRELRGLWGLQPSLKAEPQRSYHQHSSACMCRSNHIVTYGHFVYQMMKKSLWLSNCPVYFKQCLIQRKIRNVLVYYKNKNIIREELFRSF